MATSRSDITLITEATYPHSHGGVSVWCDQTIRGLAERQFDVYSLCATSASPAVWELPSNATRSVTIGLWDVAKHHKVTRSCLESVRAAFDRLLTSVLGEPDIAAFLLALRELFTVAQDGVLGSALLTREVLDDLLGQLATSPTRGGSESVPPPTVSDALEILALLEHLLRPLAAPPAQGALCHSVSNGLGVLVALGAKWTHDTPFLLTEHGLYLRERYLEYAPGSTSHAAHTFFPKFMSQLVRAGYETADIIAPASMYNRTWELACGAAPEKIRPIYNGIDPDAFPAPPPEPAAPTLAWLGRIDPLKDLKTLIRGFALVRERRPDASLRLFGGVPAGNENYSLACHELVAELGLDEGVTFEGRVDSVTDAYAAGNLVLSTSISEGFPYAVLEAMASGRCVVATAVGGVEEAIGDAGVLVPPRNPEALAEACLELLENDDQRRTLAAAAHERVRSLFTVDLSNAAYRSLYEELNGLVAVESVYAPLTTNTSSFAAETWHPTLEFAS